MSNTTTDTSAMDEKKQSTVASPTIFTNKISNFVILVVIVIAMIFFYFSSGGLILYLCKLAQTNILPTDLNCAPYTNAQPDIQEIPTNIFTKNTQPESSMKLRFPYNLNKENKMLNMFKEYKEKSSSNFLANYFIAIIEEIIQFNYSSINTIMNGMNSMLPETIIVLLGPIVGAFLYGFGLLINQLYFIYLWFSNMFWLFKYNSNNSVDELPKWENVKGFNWLLRLCLVFLFIFFIFFGLPFLIPIFAYHMSLISSLFYKGIMNNKTVTALTIIRNVLKYYKISVVITISVFVILLAFSNLGVIPGVVSILILLLIYFGVITFDMFKPISENNLSPLVPYKQATKICNRKIKIDSEGMFGGGNIAKEIKKVGKIISGK